DRRDRSRAGRRAAASLRRSRPSRSHRHRAGSRRHPARPDRPGAPVGPPDPPRYTPSMPDLLSVETALSIVLKAAPVLASERVGMDDALGRHLQEEIRADHDYPAFDKSLMDGFAVVAAAIGVLAACGRTRVAVGALPHLAVVSTGDELVEPDGAPGPGRIRNSNGPLLRALGRRAGTMTRYLGIAPDEETALRRTIE